MPTLLRTALWLLLGSWVGAYFLFAAVVAPTAFGTLSAEQAGQVVGPTLRSLHLYGLVAGLALAGIGFALRRSRLVVALPLFLVVLCAITEFGVSPAISNVRPSQLAQKGRGPGPLEQVDPEAADRFRSLHQSSMVLFSSILGGAVILLALHARQDALALSHGGQSPQTPDPKGDFS